MDQLPLWFLVLALFLPRVSLIIAYTLNNLQPYHLNGWMPPLLTIVIPRALILILIFQDRGFSPWLLVHALAMATVGVAAGKRMK
jgi:hypothetical protein